MKLKQYFSLKHVLFAIVIFAILFPLAIWQSNNVVKVTFTDTYVYAKATRYNITINYEDIVSAELAELAEPGEKVEDGYDDDLVRTGKWENDVWGEYYICADPDTSNCIVVTVSDGRILVFSRKNDETTAELYEELLTHLN